MSKRSDQYLGRVSSFYGGGYTPPVAGFFPEEPRAKVVWHDDGHVDVTVPRSRIKWREGERHLKLTRADFAGVVKPASVGEMDNVPFTIFVENGGDLPSNEPLMLELPDGRQGYHHIGSTDDTGRLVARKSKHPDPTLADELLFAKRLLPGTVDRKVQDHIKGALRTSRKFVYDAAASARLGEICRTSPELVADYGEFLRLPFERTWIEIDVSAMHAAQHPDGTEAGEPTDLRLGFLYDGNAVYVAMQGDVGTSPEPVLTPYRYRLHTAMPLEAQQETARLLGISRMGIDTFFWGPSAYKVLDPSRRLALRALHSMEWLEDTRRLYPDNFFGPMVRGGGTGDLKLVIAAAMLLLRPNLTHVISEKGPSRKLSAGKVQTFLAHTVVTVKLHPEKLVRRVIAAAKDVRRTMRWHEVRAHYCHNRAAKMSVCIHDFQEVEPNRWECSRGCGGRRWWRSYPEGRGDANVGVVTKHYHVAP